MAKTVKQADKQDRELVGYAFSRILISSIPEGISGLVKICESNLDMIPPKMQQRLAREPEVKTGGMAALKLTAFGLTPIHIVLATDAVALLFERAIDAKFFSTEKPISIYFSLQSYSDNLIAATQENQTEAWLTQGELIQEVAAFAEVNGRQAMVLLRWIIETAKFIPFMFIGFRATWKNDELELTQLETNKTPNNLFLRWSNYQFLQ